MKSYRRSHKLDNVCYDIRGAVLDEAMRLEAQGESIIKLNIGNPAVYGFRAPSQVLESMQNQLPDTEGYSDSKGLIAAREAILSYCRKKNIPCESVDDIYTGNGCSEMITMSMQALLDDGDEILVPAPDYPLWTASVNLAGGKAVHYLCDPKQNWYPDIQDMRRKITSRTKGIVVINPNNPTGVVYPKEVLEQIVELAREYELILFADEIYDRLVMDEKEHIALASLAPDLLTISFNGLSKSHLICGYRCGWICVCGDKRRGADYIEGLNLLSSMRLCSNVPAQALIPSAIECLDFTKELLVPGGRIYEQRETVCQALSRIPGVSFVRPEAAFYIFPRLDPNRYPVENDEDFALDLLRESHVLITHGTGFNWGETGCFRIAYLPECETLNLAVNRIGSFLESYAG